MATHSYSIARLGELDGARAQIRYDSAGADVLTLSGLAPDLAASFNWELYDRVEVCDEAGRMLFSGVVTQGTAMAAAAGSGADCRLCAESDWWLLEHTAYLHVTEEGVPRLAGRLGDGSVTVPLAAVVGSAFSAAAAWSGSRVGCALACSLDNATIPLNSTGSTSCASLMRAAMEWAPNAVLRMNYPTADTEGLRLCVDDGMELPPVMLAAGEDIIADVDLRPRPDLVLPAAALIGAQHFCIGGDPREPGAFVYCVARTAAEMAAGIAEEARGREKSVILGLELPPRTTRDGDDWSPYHRLASGDAALHALLCRVAPVFNVLSAGDYFSGAPRLSVLPAASLRPQAGSDPLAAADPDADGLPANYDSSFLEVPGRAHVHVEGSFAASARASRNIPGLKWCKAQLRVLVAVQQLPAALDARQAGELFSGRRKGKSGRVWHYAEISVDCNIINSCYRAVRGGRPLSSDPEFNAADGEQADVNLRTLLSDYYHAAQLLCHEGSVALLHSERHPSDLLGRRIRLAGLAPEWEGMTAICRAIDYDLPSRRMSLELGSREMLGFDMRLERARLAARKRANEEAAAAADLADPEQVAAEEEALMVEPALHAALVTSKNARTYAPFSCYDGFVDNDDDSPGWTMQGGTVCIGSETITIPTTDTTIMAGKATGTALVRGRPVRRRIYKDSKGAWTFDIYQTTP